MEEKFYAVAGYDNLYAGRDGMIKRKVIYGIEDLALTVAKGLADSGKWSDILSET